MRLTVKGEIESGVMNSMEERSTRWHVRGLVAGPALPNGDFELGSCRIKRIGEQGRRDLLNRARQRLLNLDLVAAQFGSPDVFSAEMPLTALVYSKHELTVIVDAPNHLVAYDKAEEEADRALGALTFAVGIQKYHFYPSVANKESDSGGSDTQNYMSTGIAMATVYESESLRVKAMDDTRIVLDLRGEDKAFDRAFGFLQSAWRLASVPLHDPALHKAILSNCFLVLEAVSDAVTKEWRKDNRESVLSKQETVVASLQEELNGTVDPSRKVHKVREAHTDCSERNYTFRTLSWTLLDAYSPW
jgi:hypothetical protein